MDIVLLIFGILFLIVGFIGCIMPGLPGPPISYLGLLLLEWSDFADYSAKLLLILAAIVILVTIIDFFFPIYMTKKLGGSRAGIWGSTIGLFIGMIFFNLPGTIIGPFLGAFIGEMLVGKQSKLALRAAMGSFLGFIMGTGAKLITCGIITYYFVKPLWS